MADWRLKLEVFPSLGVSARNRVAVDVGTWITLVVIKALVAILVVRLPLTVKMAPGLMLLVTREAS